MIYHIFFSLNYAIIIFLVILNIFLIYLVFRKKEKIPSYLIDFDTLKDHRFLELFSTDIFCFKVIVSKFDYERFKEFVRSISDEELREKFIFYLKSLEKKKKEKFLKIVNVSFENYTQRKKGVKCILSNKELKESFEEKGLDFVYFHSIAKLFKPKLKKGEVIKLEISRKGKYFDEAIGFLEDDTPCIVKDGAEFLGKKVDVLIENVRETQAGTILEGRIFRSNT
ncbi:MAG: TRAM domain-containing protein [Candidatus Hydrothermales bacterium]